MSSEKALLLVTGRDDWTMDKLSVNTDTEVVQVILHNSKGQVGCVEINGDEYTVTVDAHHIFQGWESELEMIELLSFID